MSVETKSSAPSAVPLGLESELGKPRSEWKTADLAKLFTSRQIRIVSLMHVGGDGWLKTLDFVPRSVGHLTDIIDGGERADGSNLFPGTGIPAQASDIILRPRPESAFLDPFSSMPTLVLMCGHAARDHTPLPQSPDTILRRAGDLLQREAGAELWALGEVEYFLGKRRDEFDIYGANEHGYHASSPFVVGEDLRRRALAILADIGVGVKYGHSEVGYVAAKEINGLIWEQHEIELALSPLLNAAEAVLLTQWVLRNLAHQNGMQCDTAPLVAEGHAGSGLHFHFAPVRNGVPLPIKQDDGSLTEAARWLIGGLVQMGGALMAFGNRVNGSFVRLKQAKEAPNTIVWGEFDRSALIRLPIVHQDSTGRTIGTPTIEFRLPDGSALPHLLLAGAAIAMLHGRATDDLDDLLAKTASTYGGDSAESRRSVPRNPEEVADALAGFRETLERGGVFPSGLIERVETRLKG